MVQTRRDANFVILQIYMACQSMLIVLIGAVPKFSTERLEDLDGEELSSQVTFTEDISSIVTEVWYFTFIQEL